MVKLSAGPVSQNWVWTRSPPGDSKQHKSDIMVVFLHEAGLSVLQPLNVAETMDREAIAREAVMDMNFMAIITLSWRGELDVGR